MLLAYCYSRSEPGRAGWLTGSEAEKGEQNTGKIPAGVPPSPPPRGVHTRTIMPTSSAMREGSHGGSTRGLEDAIKILRNIILAVLYLTLLVVGKLDLENPDISFAGDNSGATGTFRGVDNRKRTRVLTMWNQLCNSSTHAYSSTAGKRYRYGYLVPYFVLPRQIGTLLCPSLARIRQ